MAFVLFKERKDPSKLTKEELKGIKIRAELEKIDLQSQIEKLPQDVKLRYEELRIMLKDRGLSEEEREALIDQMIALVEPHIHL